MHSCRPRYRPESSVRLPPSCRTCLAHTTKGHTVMCALLLRMCESPPLNALAQCREQHYVLDGVVPRYFHFPRTLCELTTRVASGYPKLGQEIPISVTMKNQLGLFCSVDGFAPL